MFYIKLYREREEDMYLFFHIIFKKRYMFSSFHHIYISRIIYICKAIRLQVSIHYLDNVKLETGKITDLY